MRCLTRTTITVTLLIGVLWGSGVGFVEAGVDVWTSIGPEGGQIYALAIDPVTPGTLYAAADGGVFKSTDGGKHWRAANAGLTDYFVYALAVDPVTPRTLYAGTQGTRPGVFKSVDGGGSWSAILKGPFTYGLAIDPLTPSTVYLAGFVAFAGGLAKSTDGGAHWSNVGPFPQGEVAVTLALAIDPLTPSTLYAAAYVFPEGGIFKSIDGGASWSPSNSGVTTVVDALAIDPQNPNIVYAATYNSLRNCSSAADATCGVSKTTDGGQSWRNVLKTATPVLALAIDPKTPNTLYASTGGGGVFKSTNGGADWSVVNAGLSSTFVPALTIDPQSPGTLYAGTLRPPGSAGGVFKTTDGAANWSAVNTGLANTNVQALAIDRRTPSTIYAGTDGGMFKRIDGEEAWMAINAGLTNTNVHTVAIDPVTPSTLYAGTDSGVFKSTDGGGSWSAASDGLPVRIPQSNILALAIDPQTPSTLYAGTNGFGVFKSTNSSGSWSPVFTGLAFETQVFALAIDPQTPTTLYAGSYSAFVVGGGVYESADGGGTWSPANSGLIDPLEGPNVGIGVNALAIDPQAPTTLYAGTSFGSHVFKTTDGAASWSAVSTGPTGDIVSALVIDRLTSSTLYAASNSGGVFTSTDGGVHWSAINTGLTNPFTLSLALGGATHTVYVGTRGGGAFRLDPAPLVASVLPVSRSIQTGGTATAFATVINPSSIARTGCNITQITPLPGSAFFYQTTDAATNTLTGAANTPVTIPAENGFQTFLIAITASAPVPSTDVQFAFACENTSPAATISGVNTLLLSASTSPTPDIIAVAATLNQDGIVNVSTTALAGATASPAGVFAVATVNVGAGAMITVSADTGSVSLPLSVSICQTIPVTGTCEGSPTNSVTIQIDAGATPTFGIFVTAAGTVPFDPGSNRIFARFKDAGGVTRGAASVAVRTQ
jgi:photosystem II stability/assembly factor-like uncharacterized protein